MKTTDPALALSNDERGGLALSDFLSLFSFSRTVEVEGTQLVDGVVSFKRLLNGKCCADGHRGQLEIRASMAKTGRNVRKLTLKFQLLKFNPS